MHIQNLIDTRLRELETEGKVRTNFYVTDLSKCLTGVYLARKGFKAVYPERTLRIFKAGNLFEEFVVSCIDQKKIIATQERVEWPEYELSGRCDLIVEDDEGKPHLKEIKSQHSAAFHYMKERGANPIHAEQVRMYHRKLKEKYHDLRMSVVYVSKDDLCIKEFPIQPDETQEALALEKAKYLKECWDKQECPKPPVSSIMEKGKWTINWQAKYCDVHHVCLNDENWLEKEKEKIKTLNSQL